jgi:hypothetical protein
MCSAQDQSPQPTRDDAGVADANDVLAAAMARHGVELMHVPEPADRSYVASVRRQVAEADFGARLLMEEWRGGPG